jgi:hypothetical protein
LVNCMSVPNLELTDWIFFTVENLVRKIHAQPLGVAICD